VENNHTRRVKEKMPMVENFLSTQKEVKNSAQGLPPDPRIWVSKKKSKERLKGGGGAHPTPNKPRPILNGGLDNGQQTMAPRNSDEKRILRVNFSNMGEK